MIGDDLATALSLPGVGFDRFTFKVQGLVGRLTGINPSKAIKDLVA